MFHLFIFIILTYNSFCIFRFDCDCFPFFLQHSFSCRLQFFLFIYSVLNWFKWPIRPFQVHFYQRLSQLPWPEAFEFDSSAVPFRLSSQIQSTVRRIPESHITKTLSVSTSSQMTSWLKPLVRLSRRLTLPLTGFLAFSLIILWS